jgi:hypothetical protein
VAADGRCLRTVGHDLCRSRRRLEVIDNVTDAVAWANDFIARTTR